MKLYAVLFFIAGVICFPSLALSLVEEDIEIERNILSYIPDFVKVPEGGVAWEFLAETKEILQTGEDDQGIDYEIRVPDFPEALKKLDGQSIVIQGYMFPLEPQEKQGLFLLGPFPLSCPFHYHVGPSMVIEVHALKPIEFSYEPVDIKGRLELVPKDVETEVFYRLHDAVIVN